MAGVFVLHVAAALKHHFLIAIAYSLRCCRRCLHRRLGAAAG